MSSDPEQEYFSDGISEEIINMLAQVHELKVIGRTSSFAFKGQNKDLREIGGLLNARYLLEGSVRKEGDRVRITAQLIDALTGSAISITASARPSIFFVRDISGSPEGSARARPSDRRPRRY